MSAHLRAGDVSRTEDASGAAVGCPQSVESAVLRAFEDASRTREGCSAHRISLPYRKRLFFAPNASEMRRVPQEAFLSTARIFRTIGGPLRYRMPTQRQVAAAAEPGVHFSRPLAGSWLRGYQSCKLPPEIVAYISKYK